MRGNELVEFDMLLELCRQNLNGSMIRYGHLGPYLRRFLTFQSISTITVHKNTVSHPFSRLFDTYYICWVFKSPVWNKDIQCSKH